MRAPLAGRAMQVASWAFGLAGLIGVTVALFANLDDASGPLRPGWPTVGLSALLVALAHICGAAAWSRCFGTSARELEYAYFISQLGKYLPGGIWQPLGQIGLARRAGESRALIAGYIASQATFVGLGAAIAGLGTLLVMPDLPVWAPPLAASALTGMAFTRRTLLAWLLERPPALVRRGVDPRLLPSQLRINSCSRWTVGKLVLQGASFAAIVTSIDAAVSAPEAAVAYVAAWMVGVVLVPVPAGIGVREATLALMLAATGGQAAPILAASVIHRVATIAAEVLLVVGSWAVRQGRRSDLAPARQVGVLSRPSRVESRR